ncbi:MAG: beta-phosphoglucomutase [Caldilineales bacterium]|nr:beta-phosphoglucomutase [Caldilineales bacterium]
MVLAGVIFDLDGVITDTAEYHYRAWQRLANEEGLRFDRQINERLRGVSRRASLEIILAENNRQVSETQMAEWMERKNAYYVASLAEVTPADLLPGAVPFIRELREAGIRVALGSASKNARTVLERLGIADLFDVVADGTSVERTKPAPDLFLWAARQMGLPPGLCAVVEDAAAGIDAALAAGMWAIGLGPEERVGHAHLRFDSLAEVTLEQVLAGLEDASWTLVETTFDPATQRHKETLFTIGNGAFCVRGSFEEGYPGDLPACFVHRLWDDIPINFTELANIPRWIGVDIWVNGERFRLDRGKVWGYRRTLDFRTGTLRRRLRWQPQPGGPVVELRFERMVNLVDPHIALVRAEVQVVEGQAEVRVRAGLDDGVENTGLLHWHRLDQGQSEAEVWLHTRTRATGLDLAVAATIVAEADTPLTASFCDADGKPAPERRATLGPGQRLVLDKFVAVVPGFDAADPVAKARGRARDSASLGHDALHAANAAAWAALWQDMDVVIEGDIEAQLAMRFNIFHLIIAAPHWTERASIGAKTLSGFGYRHHVFWDTEIFILPLFTFTRPNLARHMLMYRWHTLPGARQKAKANGYEGAQFPWESAADGREVTPTWVPHPTDPTQLVRIWTGDIEIHITADIAYAVMQYWRVTGDDAWMADYGAQIVLEGAKFWASAAQRGEDGKYHYRNVIGPDEYHDRVDDNAFTNAMARWHLETALEVLAWLERTYPERHRRLVETLDLTPQRLAHWADVIGCMFFPQDPETGLIEQFRGYFGLQDADIAALRDPKRTRSMQALLGIEGCAATQILKQPDVLMLQYLLPDRFTPEQVRVNYAYYDPRTDHEHGSSLGPAISAIMACRVGEIEAAYGHFLRAARADLHDIRHNASDGIHAASAGGLWQAAVFGFAGLRLHADGSWSLEPRLPPHWTRLAFRFYHRGQAQSVDLRPS